MMKKHLLALAAVAALALAAVIAPPQRHADAATPNVPVNTGVMVLPLHLTGTFTTTVNGIARFSMPQPCDMIGVGAAGRVLTTGGYVNLDVLSAGVSILSAPFTFTGGAVSEGTIATAAIPDENAISINLGVATGTLNYVTVLLTCARR